MREIYVSNLSFDATEDDLRDAFEFYGDVESVKIVTDRETGRSRGFAFVTMGDEAEASDAIRGLNQRDIAGRRVSVKLSHGKAHGNGGKHGEGKRQAGGRTWDGRRGQKREY